ncbi:MAG TPA: hypothetical protein VIM84_05310, partial [Gemmatimonadales bacterium]
MRNVATFHTPLARLRTIGVTTLILLTAVAHLHTVRAQTLATWTVETIDTVNLPSNSIAGSGSDWTEPYPAVARFETASGERAFYSKQSGLWTRTIIATIPDQTVSTAGSPGPLRYKGNGDWGLMLDDDVANLQRYYESTDDGATWTQISTVGQTGACAPVKQFYEQSVNGFIGLECQATSNHFGIYSGNGGLTWATMSNTGCVTSDSKWHIYPIDAQTWIGYGGNSLD